MYSQFDPGDRLARKATANADTNAIEIPSHVRFKKLSAAYRA